MRIKVLTAIFLLQALLGSAVAQLVGRQPEWYLPTSDHCTLFVQEYGTGVESVVVLHGGFGAEHSYLLGAFEGIDKKYRLVFYDQRGSLRSPCPIEKISLQKHVEDLEELRKALGQKKLTIVAHSMGTLLGMDYLHSYPDHVRGLVLMGAMPPKTAVSEEEKRLWESQDVESKSFIHRKEIEAELQREGLNKDQSSLSPQEATEAWRIRFAGVNLYHVDKWREMQGGKAFYNADAGKAANASLPKVYDFVPDLKAHPCPIWIIDGDHDYVDPGAKKFALASEGVSNIHIQVIKKASHVSWIDAPEEVRATLFKGLADSMSCSF